MRLWFWCEWWNTGAQEKRWRKFKRKVSVSPKSAVVTMRLPVRTRPAQGHWPVDYMCWGLCWTRSRLSGLRAARFSSSAVSPGSGQSDVSFSSSDVFESQLGRASSEGWAALDEDGWSESQFNESTRSTRQAWLRPPLPPSSQPNCRWYLPESHLNKEEGVN